MATIIQLQENTKSLKKRIELEKILFEEVKKFSGLIIDIQQERLSKGKDTEGNILGTYTIATEGYALFGNIKPVRPKKAGQPYNFEWTGGFFDGMTLAVFKSKAVFRSKGKSTKELLLKHDNLMGLDEEGRQSALEEFLFDAFVNRVRQKMQLI